MAKIDHVVDHRRIAKVTFIRDVCICRGQGDISNGFESDAVVYLVEPDQRLALGVGSIQPGVDFHDLVGGMPGGRLQSVLNILARVNVKPVCFQTNAGTFSGEQHAGQQQRACPGQQRPARLALADAIFCCSHFSTD